MYTVSQAIFHATPENHALLEQLYGVEFEKPPAKPTPREIIEAYLARGDKYVACRVDDSDECFAREWGVLDFICAVGKGGDVRYPFRNEVEQGWQFAIPFDIRTGEEITELPDD